MVVAAAIALARKLVEMMLTLITMVAIRTDHNKADIAHVIIRMMAREATNNVVATVGVNHATDKTTALMVATDNVRVAIVLVTIHRILMAEMTTLVVAHKAATIAHKAVRIVHASKVATRMAHAPIAIVAVMTIALNTHRRSA